MVHILRLTHLQNKSSIKAIGGFQAEYIFSMSETLGINPAPQKKKKKSRAYCLKYRICKGIYYYRLESVNITNNRW